MQYLRPVGGGPSEKTCPRWASHAAHLVSVRLMRKDQSSRSLIASLSAASKKLGHPVPESNFAFEENSSAPQQTQR